LLFVKQLTLTDQMLDALFGMLSADF